MASNDNQLVISFDELEDQTAEFETPVKAAVHFGGAQADKFDFVNPIVANDLKELRWYVERSWQYRAKEEEGRIERVEAGLEKIGKDLFNAVFENSPRGIGMYERLMERRKEGLDCSIVIDTKEPRILRLPWELLADEGGYLFSRNPPVNIRRRMQKSRETDIRDFSLPVRVLMVVSRPLKAGFIDPRSSAEPLMDALDELGDAVEVEFLRPPTVAALMRRIRDKTKPPVHVVHFDGHGVYDPGIGLGFLLFEKDDYGNDLADSSRLGSLLNECGIPLMILDACQSAEPDDRNPFGSVAAKLIESGVGGVVAMNYSVLVETSRRLIGHFYKAIAKGESVNNALGSARLELLADTSRHHYFDPREQTEVEIELHDWFVPALYQQADELIPFKPDGKTVSAAQRYAIPKQPASGGFPPAPLHGFHGRARELLDLERAFATRNIVVLHGFGGQGKTSLAAQAAEWFTRTHLFDRAAFLSFETGASLDFVINELGNSLVGDNFQIYEGDKVDAIAQALKEKPALVVFDNFESVLPNGNAPMPADDLQKFLDAAATWFMPSDSRSLNPNSRLLITTRNPSIPHTAFTPGSNCLHKELEGLAPTDALELAASILEAHSLPRPSRVSLEELLEFLKRHPLSLQLAIPQLRHYSAEQLVEEYQTILPSIKIGEAKERNESLEVSLKFSLDRLGKDAVNLLSRLWVFEGGAWEPILLQGTEIPENEWNTLKPQLSSTALIRLEEIPGVTVPFVHFHPTLAPYLRAHIEADQSLISTLQARYWQSYYLFANFLYQTDTQNPLQARALALRELPNLKRALKLALAAEALDEAVDFADRINRFLDVFGRWRERDEVAAEVERAVGVESGKHALSSAEGKKEGRITKREYLLESGRGERLLQQGRAGEAEQVFRALLARLEGEADYDTRYDQTLVLGYLGRCLAAQGRPSQAADLYRRALALAEGLEQTETLQKNISVVHTDLADVLAASGRYAESRSEYETGLELAKKVNDDRQQGVVLGQLGTLALRQGDLNEARKNYIEAIDLFRRIGEAQHEAIYWHQLGVVAQEARDWEEAERCYKQSLAIKERINDDLGAGSDCYQLGHIASSLGRYSEAEKWYKRAIEACHRANDSFHEAMCLHALAHLTLAQNRLDEAEGYARRALAIDETLDQGAVEIWKDYNLLAETAEKRGRMDGARQWRRKEQQSFAAFAGSDVAAKTKQFEPLVQAIVEATNGNEEAKQQVEAVFEQLIAGNWRIVDAIRSIWAGERDGSKLTEGIDRNSALIVRRILQALSGDDLATVDNGHQTVNDGQPQVQPQQQEISFEEFISQLLGAVEIAAQGNSVVGKQVAPVVEQMAKDTSLPDEIRAFGRALRDVLYGGRSPKLDGVPDGLASAIRGMLGRLRNK